MDGCEASALWVCKGKGLSKDMSSTIGPEQSVLFIDANQYLDLYRLPDGPKEVLPIVVDEGFLQAASFSSPSM